LARQLVDSNALRKEDALLQQSEHVVAMAILNSALGFPQKSKSRKEPPIQFQRIKENR